MQHAIAALDGVQMSGENSPGMASAVRNKIRTLRLERGMTQAELGRRVGTSQVNVNRYELGHRGLDEDLMRRFAKALGVAPGDLFESLTLATIEADLAPEGEDDPILRPLFKLSITPYRVITDAVSRAGIASGDRILVNGRAELSEIPPGGIVAIEATHADGSSSILLRQFIPPSLLLTNRSGANSAMSLDDPALGLRFVGAVLPE